MCVHLASVTHLQVLALQAVWWRSHAITLSLFLRRVLRAVNHCSTERAELLQNTQQSLWGDTDRLLRTFITTWRTLHCCFYRARRLWGFLLISRGGSVCVGLCKLSPLSFFCSRHLEQAHVRTKKLKFTQISLVLETISQEEGFSPSPAPSVAFSGLCALHVHSPNVECLSFHLVSVLLSETAAKS